MCLPAINPIDRLALFRTCLWLRAGRWISGQEAGKTPVVWEASQQAFLAEYGPAAGGEPAAPPEAGDAAQSNDGAGFFGLGQPSKGWLPKRLVLLCRACGGFPSKRWRVFRSVNVSLISGHTRQTAQHRRFLSLGIGIGWRHLSFRVSIAREGGASPELCFRQFGQGAEKGMLP